MFCQPLNDLSPISKVGDENKPGAGKHLPLWWDFPLSLRIMIREGSLYPGSTEGRREYLKEGGKHEQNDRV